MFRIVACANSEFQVQGIEPSEIRHHAAEMRKYSKTVGRVLFKAIEFT